MSVLTPFLRRARALFVISCVALLAVGCGGVVGNGGTGITDNGGSDGGTGIVVKTPPTGPGFLLGSVTGLGPLTVDGVNVEHLYALVQDDDGNTVDPLDLQLGMVVSVQGSPIVNGTMDIAEAITVHTNLVGAVTAPYDPVTRRAGVVGQVVQVDANTVMDSLKGGVRGLGVGRLVAVSGHIDPATGVYLATRITDDEKAGSFSTRGVISDVQRDAATFRVGAQVFDYAGLTLPPLFGDGQVVRVRFQATPTAAGHWVATAVDDASYPPQEGYVGDWQETVGGVLVDPAYFYVGGLPVDASTATFVPAGSGIEPGARLRVFGQVVGGILIAYEVEVLVDGDYASLYSDVFSIGGNLSGKVDERRERFMLLGSTPIVYSDARFIGGTADDLSTYRGILEVHGTLTKSGKALQAFQVIFDSPPTAGAGG